MHRLTARFLLVLMLVGTIAPVALAISAPAPHACCLRKPAHHHGSSDLEVHAASCDSHSCCSPVTTAHWAELESGMNPNLHPPLVNLPPDAHPVLRSCLGSALRPVRGPPAS